MPTDWSVFPPFQSPPPAPGPSNAYTPPVQAADGEPGELLDYGNKPFYATIVVGNATTKGTSNMEIGVPGQRKSYTQLNQT